MATTWNDQRFYSVRRSYRRRMFPVVLGIGAAFVGVYTTVAVVLDTKLWWWGAGLISGCVVAAIMFLNDVAPEHIRRRSRGVAGERKTRKILAEFVREGWCVKHGVDVGRGDIDHLLSGPKGVYLLDTKSLLGVASVERGVLVTRQLDDPDEVSRWPSLVRRMRSLGREVSSWVASDAHVRTWVQPVVVIWGEFPQRLVEAGGIAYVAGDDLLDWLRERPPARHEVDFDET